MMPPFQAALAASLPGTNYSHSYTEAYLPGTSLAQIVDR
jgi:hypothetical protein